MAKAYYTLETCLRRSFRFLSAMMNGLGLMSWKAPASLLLLFLLPFSIPPPRLLHVFRHQRLLLVASARGQMEELADLLEKVELSTATKAEMDRLAELDE